MFEPRDGCAIQRGNILADPALLGFRIVLPFDDGLFGGCAHQDKSASCSFDDARNLDPVRPCT